LVERKVYSNTVYVAANQWFRVNVPFSQSIDVWKSLININNCKAQLLGKTFPLALEPFMHVFFPQQAAGGSAIQ